VKTVNCALLDFGLAYCPGLSEDAPSTLPGTPSYIAPEAFRGDPARVLQQDLYAVGVTLYFLLTGHFPYGEIEAFQRPRFGLPVSASRYRPDLPEWLAQSLERGVAADPQQRFETAEEWLLVLEQGERQQFECAASAVAGARAVEGLANDGVGWRCWEIWCCCLCCFTAEPHRAIREQARSHRDFVNDTDPLWERACSRRRPPDHHKSSCLNAPRMGSPLRFGAKKNFCALTKPNKTALPLVGTTTALPLPTHT
jgi:hypothetical protein